MKNAEKGVFTAGHPHNPFQGKYSPSTTDTKSYTKKKWAIDWYAIGGFHVTSYLANLQVIVLETAMFVSCHMWRYREKRQNVPLLIV